jgi:hypothetical protein
VRGKSSATNYWEHFCAGQSPLSTLGEDLDDNFVRLSANGEDDNVVSCLTHLKNKAAKIGPEIES